LLAAKSLPAIHREEKLRERNVFAEPLAASAKRVVFFTNSCFVKKKIREIRSLVKGCKMYLFEVLPGNACLPVMVCNERRGNCGDW
jgi:hypothetical protein